MTNAIDTKTKHDALMQQWSQNMETLHRLGALTKERGRLERAASAAEYQWRTVVQEAIAAGVPVSRIADAAGISRARVYQIRDNRR